MATVGKAVLFPSIPKALGGDLAEGITTEIWWSPHHPFKSSLSQVSAKELCNQWTQETGKEWLQPLGYKYAGYEIAADTLKRAGSLDKNDIREAIAETNIDTMVGKINYNKQNYSRTPLVGGQWVKGKRFPWNLKIVYNTEHPYIPLSGETFALR